MKPHLFHILLALADQNRHGSAIAKTVKQQSGGEIVLWPVTLYGSLSELEQDGAIEPLRTPPAGESERRKFYRLTRAGRRTLEAETKRLAALVSAAERRLNPRTAT
jgi:DNA-binding PadR family transcriptional regulator